MLMKGIRYHLTSLVAVLTGLVHEFPYLGSLIAESGRAHEEVDRRIASASRAFGALQQPIFEDPGLSITTKRYIYRACVLSVLLYGSECWVPLK